MTNGEWLEQTIRAEYARATGKHASRYFEFHVLLEFALSLECMAGRMTKDERLRVMAILPKLWGILESESNTGVNHGEQAVDTLVL